MKPQIDYARMFRAAARMEDMGKARELLRTIAAAADNQPAADTAASPVADKDWAAHYAKRASDIEHLHREIKSELRMVQGEVLRNLRRHFTNADIASAEGDDFMFDPEKLAADLSEVLGDALPNILIDAGQDVLPAFLPAPDAAQAFISERQNLMTDVSQEVFDSVKAELQDGLDKGESYRELAKRLSDKFDEISEGRADVVAQTEVASAYGKARNDAMIESGVKFKIWVGSGRPPGTPGGMRPAHAAAHYDGQVRAIDEPFNVGGELLMFPTDSSLGAGPEMTINCHCVAQPMEGPG
jgi:uncharacterized protein with gpF-like domain